MSNQRPLSERLRGLRRVAAPSYHVTNMNGSTMAVFGIHATAERLDDLLLAADLLDELTADLARLRALIESQRAELAQDAKAAAEVLPHHKPLGQIADGEESLG